MEKIKSNSKEILEWIYCIIIAIILALFVRYYIGTPTIVQQPSMYPTLVEGDRLILNRLTRTFHQELKRGQIVTFQAPSTELVTYSTADENSLIARYDNDPEGLWSKFVFYVLEQGKDSYIKRVIATEGEHIKIENGKVYINGEELQEDYLQPNVVTTAVNGTFTDLVVPEGCVFVMGDNREHSTDSRRFGCIPIEKIESSVSIRFWPFEKFGKIDK